MIATALQHVIIRAAQLPPAEQQALAVLFQQVLDAFLKDDAAHPVFTDETEWMKHLGMDDESIAWVMAQPTELVPPGRQASSTGSLVERAILVWASPPSFGKSRSAISGKDMAARGNSYSLLTAFRAIPRLNALQHLPESNRSHRCCEVFHHLLPDNLSTTK